MICMGCRDSIIGKFAFYPPEIDYILEETGTYLDQAQKIQQYQLLVCNKEKEYEKPQCYREIKEIGFKIKSEDEDIFCLYYQF